MRRNAHWDGRCAAAPARRRCVSLVPRRPGAAAGCGATGVLSPARFVPGKKPEPPLPARFENKRYDRGKAVSPESLDLGRRASSGSAVVSRAGGAPQRTRTIPRRTAIQVTHSTGARLYRRAGAMSREISGGIPLRRGGCGIEKARQGAKAQSRLFLSMEGREKVKGDLLAIDDCLYFIGYLEDEDGGWVNG